MSEIIALAGSPAHPSRTSAVLEYAKTILAQKHLQTELISVREFPPEDLLLAKFDSPAIKAAQIKIAEAKGIIIATPVYKAAYTGVLKAFLDLLPPGSLNGKIILPIATGGTLAHLLSIEYALKPVIATLGAKFILSGVYLLDTQIQHQNGTNVQLEPEIEQRLITALDELSEAIHLSATLSQKAPAFAS